MKTNCLQALFVLLATSHSFAQKTLAPALQPYTDGWSYHVKRMFNHAGFDLQAAAVNQISTDSHLQLDSTKTAHYDGSTAPGDSLLFARSTYEYLTADTKQETNFLYGNDGWQPLNRTTLIHDEQFRLVYAHTEVYDADTRTYLPDSKMDIFPHGDSQDLLDSLFVHQWDAGAGGWRLVLATRNTFAGPDRLWESISSLDDQGTLNTFVDAYSYDANDDNHLVETYAVTGNTERLIGRTDRKYAEHRLIEETVFAYDGVDYQALRRTNRAYTLFGKVRKNMEFEWSNAIGNWRLAMVHDYAYDNAQRLSTKYITYLKPDGYEEREAIAYAYVESENLRQETLLRWDDDLFDWVLNSKKHYYYKSLVPTRPTPQPVQALPVSPNPTTGVARLQLDTESNVQVFDLSGQLLQSRIVQPGETLDLTQLPTGTYFVTAQHGADMFRGKIVKL